MAKSYPECEKVQKVAEDSQKLGEFLGWLEDEKGLELCELDTEGRLCPYVYQTEQLLAEYYGIDLSKVETERERMIEDIRAENELKGGQANDG